MVIEDVKVGLVVKHESYGPATVMVARGASITLHYHSKTQHWHTGGQDGSVYHDIGERSYYCSSHEIEPLKDCAIPEEDMKMLGALQLSNTQEEFIALCEQFMR